MQTKTGFVARLMLNQGRGHHIFNDRLLNGRRSLKVWGWARPDYEEARLRLEGLGCQVDLVEFGRYSPQAGGRYRQLRLHVTE